MNATPPRSPTHRASPLRRLALALGLALVLPTAACEKQGAESQTPEGAAETVISLQGIDCQSCGAKVVGALQKREGVYQAEFDRDRAEVRVAYDPQKNAPSDLLAVATELGYGAVEGPGQGAYAPETVYPPELDVQQISKAGEAVELEAHLAPDKVTVIDFGAKWCGPCRVVARHMLGVLREQPDVALRKIDVVDWDSEVAQAYLGKVSDLPYVVVYDTQGEQVAAIAGLDLDALDAAIAKGRR